MSDEQPIARERVYRHGLAEIVTNAGGGAYTITAQEWDGAAWTDTYEPDLIGATARAHTDDAVIGVGELVLFWEQVKADGGAEFLILAQPSGAIPIGGILMKAFSATPPHFLECTGVSPDGPEVSRTTYSALFAAIGTMYGSGDGATTFNIPGRPGWDDEYYWAIRYE